jgi:hypothetical protein
MLFRSVGGTIDDTCVVERQAAARAQALDQVSQKLREILYVNEVW